MEFFSLLTPPKRPKKLTHACLPKIWIDPYIWQAPSNVLIKEWEDLALNTGTLPIKMIDPYFWQTPSNFTDHRIGNACDPYFWQTIHIFGKALRDTKMASLGHKNDFFHPALFFSLGSTP